MIALLTNEWINITDSKKPWRNREVLVRMSDDTKRTLEWNGQYWVDPKTKVRQIFSEEYGVYPTHFYIFEKFKSQDE